MPSLLQKLWSRQVLYVPLLAIALILMMVRRVVMAHVFSPEEFAAFSAGLLIASAFLMIGVLGLYPLLQRELPSYFATGREQAGRILLAQNILVALVLLLPFAAIALLVGPYVKLTPWEAIISAANGLSQQLFLTATVESRSRLNPLRFSLENLVRAVGVVLLSVAVAMITHSAAATLLIEAIVTGIGSFLIMRPFVQVAKYKWSHSYILAARHVTSIDWRTSRALLLVSALSFLILSADSWFAASLLSQSAFAAYAFIATVGTSAQSIQSILNASLFPSLAHSMAKVGLFATFRLALVAIVITLFLGGFAAVPMFYILRTLISEYFSAYGETITILPIALAVSVIRVSDFWSSYLIVIKKEKLIISADISGFLTGFALWLFVVVLPSGISKIGLLQVAWLALFLALASPLCKFFFSLWATKSWKVGTRQDILSRMKAGYDRLGL
ncbi:MAG: hypothetical protein J0H40_16935 [Rhizobiales bacterium]|nr:hypothetical protein [Hyphomicrobiales bacterium]